MEIHFKIVGLLLILLAMIHVIFPKYFNWKAELTHLSLINRQMMTTHTFFIALTVFLMGVLCFTSSTELVATDLGKKISLGLGMFWGIRLFFQLFIYSSRLWRGRKFETVVHIIFTGLWSYLTIVFILVWAQ